MEAPMRHLLTLLLLAIPCALVARLLHWPAPAVFALSGLAIVPLAKWIGTATEHLAVHVGPSLAGLLNATFGNATELIIALFALRAGLLTNRAPPAALDAAHQVKSSNSWSGLSCAEAMISLRRRSASCRTASGRHCQSSTN